MEIPKLNKNSETILAVVVGIAVLYILYKLTGAFTGLVDGVKDIFGAGSTAAEANDKLKTVETLPDNQNAWSPEYSAALRKKLGTTKVVSFTPASRQAMAKRIEKAGSPWAGGVISGAIIGAKPADIWDVFTQLKTKLQVSDLASTFSTMYKKDMLNYIVQGLRENQPLTQSKDNTLISKILDRVAKLPAY